MSLNQEQLLKAVRARYGGRIILDAVERAALEEDDLTDAVSQVVMVCAMWDSPTGDPLDCRNLILAPAERQEKNERDDRLAIMRTVWNALLKGHQVFSDVARMVAMQAALRKYHLQGTPSDFLRRLVETGFLTNGCLADVKILRINPKNQRFTHLDSVRRNCGETYYKRELNKLLLDSWPNQSSVNKET